MLMLMRMERLYIKNNLKTDFNGYINIEICFYIYNMVAVPGGINKDIKE